MKTSVAYLIRFILGAVGCAVVLGFFYWDRPFRGADSFKSYLITCSLLSMIGLAGCLLRFRRSRVRGFISAAGIAFIVSLGLIVLSNVYELFDGKPWEYFYADDGFFTFVVIVPISLAILSGLLTLIPKQRTAS